MEKNGIVYKDQASYYVEEFEQQLSQVIDTEITLDIVNLGLIYSVDLNKQGHCLIHLTFTSAGCPCAADILDGIHDVLDPLDWIKQVEIKVVWQPAWQMNRISRLGRIALGIHPGR